MRKLGLMIFFALFLLFVGVFVNQLDTSLKQTAQTSCARAIETECAPDYYFSVSTISFVKLAEILGQLQLTSPTILVLQPAKINFYRMLRFNQFSHLIFQSNFLDFQTVRELLQLKGFYLFQLCKLLI